MQTENPPPGFLPPFTGEVAASAVEGGDGNSLLNTSMTSVLGVKMNVLNKLSA